MVKVNERHDWIWRTPEQGKKTCQKCGMVVGVWKHDKLGACPGNKGSEGTMTEAREKLEEIKEKLLSWVAAYKDIAERHALAETPQESADFLLGTVLAALASVPDEELVRKVARIICTVPDNGMPCVDCFIKAGDTLSLIASTYAARVGQARKEERKKILNIIKDYYDLFTKDFASKYGISVQKLDPLNALQTIQQALSKLEGE